MVFVVFRRAAWYPVGPILFCAMCSMLFYRFCISAMSNQLNDVSAQNGTTLVLGAGAFSRYTRQEQCIAGIAEDETNTSSLGGKVCSRSTPVDPNACCKCSGVLSLHACLRSRSTPVDPNASSKCSGVLSLDARLRLRSTHVAPNAFSTCPSVLSLEACLRSRSTPVHPNASSICLGVQLYLM